MRLKTIRADESITHVALIGRLDVDGVKAVQYEFLHLTTSLPKSTLVDISQVSYIASFGLSMLVSAAKYLERHGARMVLLAPSELVRKTIETSSLNEVIPLADEESIALEVLR